MSEFDDVNRYLESMYRVFYSLLAIADEARGREPRRVYTCLLYTSDAADE